MSPAPDDPVEVSLQVLAADAVLRTLMAARKVAEAQAEDAGKQAATGMCGGGGVDCPGWTEKIEN